jgi:hypothetical protein
VSLSTFDSVGFTLVHADRVVDVLEKAPSLSLVIEATQTHALEALAAAAAAL